MAPSFGKAASPPVAEENDYATKSPLVTMGCPTFTTKTASSLRRSPPASNTPFPRPTPLTTSNGIWIQLVVLTQYTFRTNQPTDKPIDRWSRQQTNKFTLYWLYNYVANNTCLTALCPGLPKWAHTHTHTHNRCGFSLEQPGWASTGTRRNIHPLTLIVIINHPNLLPPSTTIHGILSKHEERILFSQLSTAQSVAS